MLVPIHNINQKITSFLNKYEPGLYQHPTRKTYYRMTFQSSLIQETVPVIALNYGDILIANKYVTSCVIAPPQVINKVIVLERLTWGNFDNCGRIETLLLPPDTQFTRIKVNKVPKDFDVFTRAVKLLASEDNTLTKDDFRKVIWYMQNSKHPIIRLFSAPIDELITNFTHDWVYNWVEKIINFD